MNDSIDAQVVETTPDKRALTRIQVHGVIRDTALSLFHARGFDAVTTTDIARQAGVTQRTLFRHFATKDAILFDGLDVVDWVASALRRHATSEDPRRRIRLALEDLADDYDAHAGTLRLLYSIISACPRLETIQSRHDSLVDNEMASAIGTFFGAPSTLAAEVTAGAVMGLMRPIIRAWLVGELSGPLRLHAVDAWPTIDRLIDEGLACGAKLTK